MNEIICPHCSKAFKVDEAGYASIVSQVAAAPQSCCKRRSSTSCQCSPRVN